MLLRPTRVHAKFGGFHIPAPGYTKNAPDFTLPNKDTPKTHLVLYPNPCRRTFSGRMQYAPTWVRAKFARFHISAHGHAKKPSGFTLPNRDTPKPRPVLHPNLRRGYLRGVCFCAPTRVRAKFSGFHISAPGYTKNAPDFTFPNRDTPKTYPVLDPNPWRRTFRGVCNTPLHGYVQNLAGFIFPHTTWRETRRVLDFATRHGTKPGGFWTLPHDMARNPAGFGLCHTT